MEDAVEGGMDDWGEVVTREPYRKVRLDHLLSKEMPLGHTEPCTFVLVCLVLKDLFFQNFVL